MTINLKDYSTDSPLNGVVHGVDASRKLKLEEAINNLKEGESVTIKDMYTDTDFLFWIGFFTEAVENLGWNKVQESVEVYMDYKNARIALRLIR